MQNPTWQLAQTRDSIYPSLQKELQIGEALCQLLDIRGIDDFDSAKKYFRPSLSECHDPYGMKDMHKAVHRILQAINQKEKILIYGDYDVDGTTSVAMLFDFFCTVYDKNLLDYYIPHRYREGYGLTEQGIHFAVQNEHRLLICIDCGIRSVELINDAKKNGIDTIICDHHLPGEILPDAFAILNPKQADCPYPYKELCGCGIGFKLVDALQKQINPDSQSHFQYLDWVACAIAADIVDMTGENRVLAYFGLKKINENPSVSIRAMLDVAGHKQTVTVSNMVFIIAPRINAAGRMDDARKVVELLLEKDPKRATEMAGLIQIDNTERREIESEQSKEALQMAKEDSLFSKKFSTVLYAPHWLKGVVGIMASRLQEVYYRPTIILTNSEDGSISGSARSIPEINICEIIGDCSDLLIKYGGHAAAAGLSMNLENLNAFKDKFERLVKSRLSDILPKKYLYIDITVSFNQLTNSFMNIIGQMEPFGPKNPRPLFVSYRVRCISLPQLLKEKHVKFKGMQDGLVFECVGFGLAHKFDLLEIDKLFDIVYHAEWNEFNNEKKLQLRLMDLRISE